MVVLKVLKENAPSLNDELYQRFITEARIMARLDHPNIVRIYDVGFLHDSRPFLVMDFLEGEDAFHHLKHHGPMPPHRILPMMLDLLDGIAQVHEKGIVHKDLKPSNVFLVNPHTDEERLVLLDFGVARRAFFQQQMTVAGQIVGTCRYLAPEYITRQEVSPAMDVYQLGLVLVELLTGRAVVDEDDIGACLMAHCRGNLPVPPPWNENQFGALVRLALHIDPTQRFENGAVFRDALNLYLDSSEGRTMMESSVALWGRKAPDSQHLSPMEPPRTGQPTSPSRASISANTTTGRSAPLSTRSQRRVPTPTRNHTYDELFERATEAYMHHDHTTALKLFEACHALRPQDSRVVHNINRLKAVMPKQ